jgi:hypothetical protein
VLRDPKRWVEELLATRAGVMGAAWVLIIGAAMTIHHQRVESADRIALATARTHLAEARRELDASIARRGQRATPSGLRDESCGPVVVPLPSESSDVDLPLSKQAVVAGMKAVKPAVDECYRTWRVPGVVIVRVVIDKGGRIVDAHASPRFGGTPTGRCVEASVRAARFPRSAGLTLDYPFNLRP